MILKKSSFPSRAVSWVAFFLIGAIVCFGGFFRSYHNWDEIPYVYLASNDRCSADLHRAHYKYLEESVSSHQVEIAALRKSLEPGYRRRAFVDYKYFCSNLPFYTTKRLYVFSLRWLGSLTGDALTAVRVASALPGLLWYIVLGVAVLLWLPGGVFAKVPSLLLLGKIGEVLARLSTPDALSCLMMAASALIILLAAKSDQARLTIPGLPPPLAIALSGILAGFSIAIRSNIAIVVIVFTCGIAPYIRRGMAVAFAGSAFLAYALISKSLSGLLAGYPDSYSHLTLLMFHSGGLFGPSGDPLADIRQIRVSEIVSNLAYYKPYVANIIKSSARSALSGGRQMLGCLMVIFLSTFSSCHVGRGRVFVGFLVPQSFWVVSSLVGLGYIAQVALFPLADIRMIAPYVSVIVAASCLLMARPSSKVSFNLSKVK